MSTYCCICFLSQQNKSIVYPLIFSVIQLGFHLHQSTEMDLWRLSEPSVLSHPKIDFSGLSWSLSSSWSKNSRNFFGFVTCSSEFLPTTRVLSLLAPPFFPFLASKCWGILGLSTGTLFLYTLFHSHFTHLYADESQKYISSLFLPFV